jgi:DUF4097 and DUF4098 domain-containing protein YvlB
MTSIDNEFTRTFPAPEGLTASIELGSGLVNVTAADVTEAVVMLAPSSPGDSDALDLIARSRVDLHGSTLRIDVPRVTGFRPHPDVVVEATVPTGSSLSVKSGSADVRLTGTYSETSVKTGSGDVWVDAGSTVQVGTGSGEVQLGLVDTASVKAASGSVSVERARHNLDLTTASGTIHVAELGGDARLHSASGDVEVGASAGEVSVKTASGAISVRARRGEVKARSATGNVVVAVADGTPTLLDCSSVTGTMRSELEPSEAPPDDSTERLLVRARTVSGNITIRRAD